MTAPAQYSLSTTPSTSGPERWSSTVNGHWKRSWLKPRGQASAVERALCDGREMDAASMVRWYRWEGLEPLAATATAEGRWGDVAQLARSWSAVGGLGVVDLGSARTKRGQR